MGIIMRSELFFIISYGIAMIITMMPIGNKYTYSIIRKQIKKELSKAQLFRKSRLSLILLLVSIAVNRMYPQINIQIGWIVVLMIVIIIFAVIIHSYSMANYELYKISDEKSKKKN